MNLVNETFISFINYYTIAFTDFAENFESKSLAGWCINVLLAIMLFINIIPILIEYWRFFIMHMTRIYNKFHHKCTKFKNKYFPCISFKFLEWFYRKKENVIDPIVV